MFFFSRICKRLGWRYGAPQSFDVNVSLWGEVGKKAFLHQIAGQLDSLSWRRDKHRKQPWLDNTNGLPKLLFLDSWWTGVVGFAVPSSQPNKLCLRWYIYCVYIVVCKHMIGEGPSKKIGAGDLTFQWVLVEATVLVFIPTGEGWMERRGWRGLRRAGRVATSKAFGVRRGFCRVKFLLEIVRVNCWSLFFQLFRSFFLLVLSFDPMTTAGVFLFSILH